MLQTANIEEKKNRAKKNLPAKAATLGGGDP